MSRKLSFHSEIFSAAAMIVLISDPKTAFSGAWEGLALCLKTVIPSLMPFFVLSVMLTASLSGKRIPVMKPMRRLCGIPEGAEGLFLLGLLGGYPVGAQAVTQSWENGSLSKSQAHRMLGFCSNCGPSFLFGITATFFTRKYIPWVLWGIHILSAILTAMVLPGKTSETVNVVPSTEISISEAIHKGIHIMSNVCAWILVSRCFLAYLDKWILHVLPDTFRVLVIGVLELTNGCLSLSEISSEATRFIMVSGFLALGGLCVGMQTVSVTGKLGTGRYFQGKGIQFTFSLMLAAITAPLLFPGVPLSGKMLFLPIILLGIIRLKRKKK